MDDRMLLKAAEERLQDAYAPYSHFHVAAALLCGDGSVYTGVNVENASYPATVCAERCAFLSAVNDGKREFLALALCGGREGVIGDYCPPCGICRQVMREFCDPKTFRIVLGGPDGAYRTMTLEELLPMSFGPEAII